VRLLVLVLVLVPVLVLVLVPVRVLVREASVPSSRRLDRPRPV